MKGYKAFFKRDGKLFTGGIGGSVETEWKIGKSKKAKGEIELCGKWFHFFKEKNACFALEFFGVETVICEILAEGDVKSDTYKCVTNKIRIISEATKEVEASVDNNSNSGDRNSGDRNSGYSNSGDSNSGDRNSGDSNSGDRNSGDRNSGDRNSGNRNSGDSNSGDRNSGIFNTNEPFMRSFNKPTKIKFSEWINSRDYIFFALDLEEKTYKEAWAEWWKKNKSKEMKDRIKSLPNFDAKIFKEITGINIKETK